MFRTFLAVNAAVDIFLIVAPIVHIAYFGEPLSQETLPQMIDFTFLYRIEGIPESAPVHEPGTAPSTGRAFPLTTTEKCIFFGVTSLIIVGIASCFVR